MLAKVCLERFCKNILSLFKPVKLRLRTWAMMVHEMIHELFLTGTVRERAEQLSEGSDAVLISQEAEWEKSVDKPEQVEDKERSAWATAVQQDTEEKAARAKEATDESPAVAEEAIESETAPVLFWEPGEHRDFEERAVEGKCQERNAALVAAPTAKLMIRGTAAPCKESGQVASLDQAGLDEDPRQGAEAMVLPCKTGETIELDRDAARAWELGEEAEIDLLTPGNWKPVDSGELDELTEQDEEHGRHADPAIGEEVPVESAADRAAKMFTGPAAELEEQVQHEQGATGRDATLATEAAAREAATPMATLQFVAPGESKEVSMQERVPGAALEEAPEEECQGMPFPNILNPEEATQHGKDREQHGAMEAAPTELERAEVARQAAQPGPLAPRSASSGSLPPAPASGRKELNSHQVEGAENFVGRAASSGSLGSSRISRNQKIGTPEAFKQRYPWGLLSLAAFTLVW